MEYSQVTEEAEFLTQPRSVATPTGRCHESRCICGHLVAKLQPYGVELKCKRCKRIVFIPYDHHQDPA